MELIPVHIMFIIAILILSYFGVYKVWFGDWAKRQYEEGWVRYIPFISEKVPFPKWLKAFRIYMIIQLLGLMVKILG